MIWDRVLIVAEVGLSIAISTDTCIDLVGRSAKRPGLILAYKPCELLDIVSICWNGQPRGKRAAQCC
jgi:hypothetical protein